MNAPLELVLTQDGTLACADPTVGEWTHNRAGALTEAMSLYTRPANLARWLAETSLAPRPLCVLDACFGLGWNTWSLLLEILALATADLSIHVFAVENNPRMLSLIPQILESPKLEPLKSISRAFGHNVSYQTFKFSTLIETTFVAKSGARIVLTLEMAMGDLRAIVAAMPSKAAEAPEGAIDAPPLSAVLQGVSDVDLIFHDAYSPRRMPELWTYDLFARYYQCLSRRRGRLLTYSAAGAVRGGLREAGFVLGRTPALGHKSGGTLASVCLADDMTPLDAAEKVLIESRSGLPYRDPTLNDPRDVILTRRAQEQARSDRVGRAAPIPAGDRAPDAPSS